MVVVGEKAPGFRAHSSQGHTLESASFVGKTPMVLFFFPKAGTRGCDIEIAGFNERLKDFGQNRVQVLGVSRDSPRELREYAEKHGIKVTLLGDQGSQIIRDYGVEKENGTARRVTVIVDRNGDVAHVFDPVTPEGHPEEVLDTIKRLRQDRPETMTRPTG